MVDNELRAEAVYQQLEEIEAPVFYEKQLTSSDVSASGRVVIPKVSSSVTPAQPANQQQASALCGVGSHSSGVLAMHAKGAMAVLSGCIMLPTQQACAHPQ
jgi:hypothetical protein